MNRKSFLCAIAIALVVAIFASHIRQVDRTTGGRIQDDQDLYPILIVGGGFSLAVAIGIVLALDRAMKKLEE